jgi:hypothetical protein
MVNKCWLLFHEPYKKAQIHYEKMVNVAHEKPTLIQQLEILKNTNIFVALKIKNKNKRYIRFLLFSTIP